MKSASVVADVAAAIREHPEADALETATGVITYFRLGELITHFVERLDRVTQPGEFIGIEATRSAGSVVAMIGALMAGRPYMFVDPRDSASIAHKIGLLGITTVATTEHPLSAPVLGGIPARWGVPPQQQPAGAGQALATLPPADRLAYAIHTSGSTGEPKCVLVRADPLAPVIRDHVRRLEVGPGCRTLQFARLTFDGCVTEILWTLTSGACLVILGEDQLGPGPTLQTTLEEFRITHLKTTPFALTATEPSSAMSLRHVINGGGACRPSMVRTWSPVTAFHNAWGTTETTVCNLLSDVLDVEDCTDAVPLGDLVGAGGLRIESMPGVTDPDPGTEPPRGELVMTGDCVALGYLTAAGLQPFTGPDGERIYRTGDIVHRRAGRLHFVERRDQQIKVRGYRLDPGEIEAAACRLPGVSESVVTAEAHGPATSSDSTTVDALVCYYLGSATGRDVRAHLEAVLDPYQVPSVIRQVLTIPYTRNGKVDREALREGRNQNLDGGAPAPAPARSRAQQVLDHVEQLTGTSDVTLADNFYDVGGDSASTVLLVQMLKQLGWMDVGVRDVLRADDLNALVTQLPDQGR